MSSTELSFDMDLQMYLVRNPGKTLEDYAKELHEELYKAIIQIRTYELKKALSEFHPADCKHWDSIGDLIEISDFVDYCNSGSFIDYDGFGFMCNRHPLNGDIMLEYKSFIIKPSDIKIMKDNGLKFPKFVTHISWLNR